MSPIFPIYLLLQRRYSNTIIQSIKFIVITNDNIPIIGEGWNYKFKKQIQIFMYLLKQLMTYEFHGLQHNSKPNNK